MSSHSSWAADDRRKLKLFGMRFETHARTCAEEFDDVLSQRRKLHSNRIPLWKELGPKAIETLRQDGGSDNTLYLTQWSGIFDSSLYTRSQLRDIRDFAALVEKGGDKIWDKVQGKHVVMWVPSDANAASRCRAALLRRAAPDRRPTSLRFVSEIPLLPAMESASNITDVW
ncbi:unnamed protein product [Prorocentrum cordatum]|uniref:Uncharacterized protein n=1 Tax=Prorocentrum cordatum TaxID=2364126 RepID=A0ABN9U9J5_9DINO|nr:unnamed protein product [Polarella glacialis]